MYPHRVHLHPKWVRVFQTPSDPPIGADSKLIAKFEAFRKKRNLGDYSIAGATSKKEADEMVALAQQLREDVQNWIRCKYPELL